MLNQIIYRSEKNALNQQNQIYTAVGNQINYKYFDQCKIYPDSCRHASHSNFLSSFVFFSLIQQNIS